jgi:hypothetical protein
MRASELMLETSPSQPHGHDHLSKAVLGMRCGNYGKNEKIGCVGKIGYL